MFRELKSASAAPAQRRAIRWPRQPLLRRFVRHRQGSTMVEFGLVGAPFIALAIGILQTGLTFFAGQALETGAATASRLIMTGAAQTQGWSAAQFKQQVCAAISSVLNCASSVYVDVEKYSSFASANLAMPISNGTFNASSLGYNPGGPGDKIIVRLYYQFPAYMNLMGFSLSNLNNGNDLLAATAVFQNEPYGS